MRILVVEDEHKIAQALKKGLEQEAYSVDVAFTGTDGYDMASTEEYDVIVLDLMLPEMDGITVCKKLRDQKVQTPVLMLTAKSELEDKVKGLNTGADDYLTKPFAFEELLARIRALLRRPKNATENVLSTGNVQLDTITYSVKKDGKLISLSKKEYSLLEYLMRNKNKTVTKDQIISHVWDYDSDILNNTVEQYVGYLRNKLGKDLIQTVRGFGYTIRNGGQ